MNYRKLISDTSKKKRNKSKEINKGMLIPGRIVNYNKNYS